ncbi:DUF551 domain-containing protein [Salmonella enterica]|uniref:DUF551 domain-containing protein n=1 Tax=Salmonella senftenberg TaxID=28150 RepID=A0A725V244_SALSE|nr:DUF551 domain-containing protein [Salmonella enterica]ECC3099179.1 DUF551 domain-containing protein [Salmonella enterica subsp. enterica]EAY2050223.1 DUF551 domain-containing protein [Salmonella enterica]EIT2969336.1 DUF551 domain-containing protein [Salmonella enterica]EIT3330314.1 DUF551 domain-containing protein [Salmonella enterica]EIT3351470.1 DUF551 domain-containing protein [Salmonella enterica]
MSTITKERVAGIARGEKCYTHDDVVELARIALASLEAEPVGEVIEQQSGMMLDGLVISEKPIYRNIKGIHNMKMMPLGTQFYAAHPAPVSVPAAMEMDDDFDSAFEHGKAVGWNSYRAAMLQSFGNSEQLNSPVIPDGWVACSELMPEQFKAILAFNEYGEVWSGAYDRYWNFYCDNLLVEHVTHWMPLPAAPQQEA